MPQHYEVEERINYTIKERIQCILSCKIVKIQNPFGVKQ